MLQDGKGEPEAAAQTCRGIVAEIAAKGENREADDDQPPVRRHSFWLMHGSGSRSGQWREVWPCSYHDGSAHFRAIEAADLSGEATLFSGRTSKYMFADVQAVSTSRPASLPKPEPEDYECCICLDMFRASAGIACNGAGAHFACSECFGKYVRIDVESEETFPDRDGSKPCFGLQCQNSSKFTLQQIKRHLSAEDFIRFETTSKLIDNFIAKFSARDLGDDQHSFSPRPTSSQEWEPVDHECIICWETFRASAGIACDGPDKHFACDQCFAECVRIDVQSEETFPHADGSKLCFGERCRDSSNFTLEQIKAHLSSEDFFRFKTTTELIDNFKKYSASHSPSTAPPESLVSRDSTASSAGIAEAVPHERSQAEPPTVEEVQAWSVDDVCDWLGSLNLPPGAIDKFRENEVDHEELLDQKLDCDKLLDQVGIKKLSHRNKIKDGMSTIPCLNRMVTKQSSAESTAAVSLPEDPSECLDLMQRYANEWHQGRWALEEQIGEGGKGVVYRADDKRLRQLVALKYTCIDLEHQRKATREAVILQKVQHPHVCAILQYHEYPGVGLFAMVLELMNRGSLADRLMAQGGRLEQREVVNIAFEILQALAHVHDLDIVHRDVKPANILRHRHLQGVVHKLGDFGIAVAETKASGLHNTLQTRTVGLQADIGTPMYMSPEQLKKGEEAGTQSDLWAMGVVMYEALVGRRPFAHDEADDFVAVSAAITRDEPKDPRELTEPGVVDDGVAELVLKALRKPIDERFDSAATMANALETALRSTSEDGFDIFINYRVWCEKDFAAELFQATEKLRIGQKRRRPRVYLDKVRLLDGQRFDLGFTVGLAQSLVFAPLMSSNCMKPFTALGREDKVDFVLVEYIMALALHSRGIVKAIMPVILNEQDDGTHTEAFFQQLLSSSVDGSLLPDVVSEKSYAKAAEFLSQLPPEHDGPIIIAIEERWSVKRIVDEMLKYQAVLLHLDRAWDSGRMGPELHSSISSSHGTALREATRSVVVQKLAARLIGVVEKCADPQPARPLPQVALTQAPQREQAALFQEPSAIVVSPSHVASLAEWLPGTRLNLLWRATRDGRRSIDFHRQCDDQGPTLTVIQDTQGFIFGGFTETPWTSQEPGVGARRSPLAFLFTLRCHAGLDPTRMALKDPDTEYAVDHDTRFGPTFGGKPCDLYVVSNNRTDEGASDIGSQFACPARVDGRTLLTGGHHFQAAEIEVFRVLAGALESQPHHGEPEPKQPADARTAQQSEPPALFVAPEPEPESNLDEQSDPPSGIKPPRFPVLPMSERKYDFFLNHCQKSGQDQCANLYKLLTAAGAKVWYDMQAQDLTAQGMEKGVAESRNVLIFLSEEVMGRPFCNAEQRWAVHYKCSLIGVVEKDERHGGGREIFSKEKDRAPKDLKHLLDEVEFIDYERRDYKAKGMLEEIIRRGGVTMSEPDMPEMVPPQTLEEFLGAAYDVLHAHLDELGVEKVEDLQELEEEEVAQLAVKLKKVQAKKFVNKVASSRLLQSSLRYQQVVARPETQSELQPQPEPAVEDAYQAMLRQRAADDATMSGQASSARSLGFGPITELAGGAPATMRLGEQQRFDVMAQMNGLAPGAGQPPPLDTDVVATTGAKWQQPRRPAELEGGPGDVVAMMGGLRVAPTPPRQQQQGLGVKHGEFVLDFD